VVGLALQVELGELDAVERRNVIAIMHDEPVRIVARVDGLGLAPIQLVALFHEVPGLRQAIARQAKPSSWSAMPIQSGVQASAAANAARAMSGVLFCFERCAARMCCSRLVSSAASNAAAASLCKWPKRPAMRCFSEAGEALSASRSR